MRSRILSDRRGAITAVVAVVGIVLIGFAGFALDLTRAWMVSARLKTAVDAAALLAAREIDQTNRDTEATALFWVNYRRNQPASSSYLGSTASNPTITQLDANRIQVSGTATVSTTLFSVITRRNMTVTEVSVAQRQGTGLELALVIDQTSSMNGRVSGQNYTKLQAAQSAVGTLLNILYGPNDIANNLWVSVVPFSRTINIGTANATLLNTSGMPNGWSQNAWSGCVEARTASNNDLSDAAPTTPPTRFRPYFWPSTYGQVGTVDGGRCTSGNAYGAIANGNTRYCFGDNDWGAPSLSSNPSYSFLRNEGMSAANAAGPNFLCNLTPLTPLTASRSAVQAAVNAITAPIRSGGTAILPGLQGAWYTLSPNWQGVWQNTNGTGGPTLPLAYNTRNMRKAIILLSDGDNNWQPSRSYSDRVRGNNNNGNGNDLFYSAYGRANHWNGNGFSPAVTAGDQSTGDSAMDARMRTLCANIKSTGILIYVIGFEVANGTHRQLLQDCSSGTNYYYESPSAAELQTAFRQVANSLASLRLTE